MNMLRGNSYEFQTFILNNYKFMHIIEWIIFLLLELPSILGIFGYEDVISILSWIPHNNPKVVIPEHVQFSIYNKEISSDTNSNLLQRTHQRWIVSAIEGNQEQLRTVRRWTSATSKRSLNPNHLWLQYLLRYPWSPRPARLWVLRLSFHHKI